MPIDRKNLPPMPTGFTPPPEEVRPSADGDAATQPATRAVRVPLGSEAPPAWGMYIIDRVDQLDRTIEGNHRVQLHAIEGLRERIGSLERWRAEEEERIKHHSSAIQKGSDTDVQHAGAISTLVIDVADLKTAVAENTAATMAMKKVIVDDVKGFFKENPEVVRSLVTFLVTFMGFVSAYFAAKGH